MRKEPVEDALEQCNQVFVYGTLKNGYGNNRILRNAKFFGKTSIKGNHKIVDLGPFPAVVEEEDDNAEKVVIGEVFQIPDEDTMESLDMLEGYPDFYNRKIVETEYGPCWMYFMFSNDHHKSPRNRIWGVEKSL